MAKGTAAFKEERDLPGAGGGGADIFVCTPAALGPDTLCDYRLFWDGSLDEFPGERVDGIFIDFQ